MQCEKVADTAAMLSGSLSQLTDSSSVTTKLQALTAATTTLQNPIDAFEKVDPAPCRTAHVTALAKHKQDLDDDNKAATSVQTQLKDLQMASDSIKGFQRLLNDVLEDQYPFNEPFYPPTVGTATGVTVVTFRTNLRQMDAKEQKVATMFVQIGESAVSVSAGLASTSPWAHIIPDVLSTGVGVNLGAPGSASQTDWLPIAAGWRAGSDHVLFVVGLHLTRSDCLPDPNDAHSPCSSRQGFKIGDVVPTSLSDPLPVERVWTRGILVGVSFRTE